MKTPCKECVFAEYEEKTQTGCQLGLIEKYQAKDLVEECYDEDNEFFVIGQLCMYCRGPEWEGIGNAKEVVKEEVRFRADLVITFNGILEDLKRTLAGAAQFESIIVINPSGKTPNHEIVALLKGNFKSWFVESTFVESEGKEIDIAAKRAKSSYYVVVKSGIEIPLDYCDRVNKAMEDGLLAFISMQTIWGENLVWGNNFATVYNKPIHKLLGGHEDGTIEEKVKKICEETEQSTEKYLLQVQL